MLFESLLHTKELKDLYDCKFNVESTLTFTQESSVKFNHDSNTVHNIFTVSEKPKDKASMKITLSSSVSDCSVAWLVAIKSVLKNYEIV